MNSANLLERFPSKSVKENWLDTVSRRFVLNVLNNIQVGQLTIEDDGEVFKFGRANGKDITGCNRHDIAAHIKIKHPSAYRFVFLNGTVGSGESYMLGGWETSDLVSVIRLMVLNIPMLQKLNFRWSVFKRATNSLLHRQRKNSIAGSKKNISAHYDLGNSFFSTFLDSTMLYSSAIFPTPNSTLKEASLYKMATICRKLELKSSDHLLEIGSGWGGMAIYAAKNFGCKVTSVTLSKEQWQYANEWVARENLQDKVDILLRDYRDISGKYDKLVSIEMIEAVGHRYYDTYFKACSKLLKPNGLMLIQSITIPDQRFQYAKNNVDFIQRYIFPGGCLPSNEVLTKQLAKNTDMQLVGLDDITAHYAKTIKKWREAFDRNAHRIKSLACDEIFMRMWNFYLCYCEGGFRERAIGTVQILCAKPEYRSAG